ncbi:MAG: hypothetical protein ABEK59_01225 [Halobacteria archaeon]
MGRGNPKFDTKAERVRFAIRKKYLSEEEWSNSEIADELNVREEMVSRYLNKTPQAEEVQKARNALEKEKWKEMVADLTQRIDKLAELERQLWNVVEPVVSSYEIKEMDAELTDYHLQSSGGSLQLDLTEEVDDETHGEDVEVEIPIPEQWKEIPEFSRLRSVWDERRRTEEQLANLLGLDADDTLRLEGEVTDRKVFSIEDDSYPDAEPHAVDEEPPQETSEDSEEEGNSDD